MPRTIHIVFHLLAIPGIGAATFQPNCTLPIEGTKFHVVSGPNIRSTWDILWSCLFTIFICNWTVLHMEVGELGNQDDRRGFFSRLWRRQARKLFHMLTSILAPEILLGLALNEYFSVLSWSRCDVLKDFARANGMVWTKTHAYFAEMDGFVLTSRLASSNADARTGSHDGGQQDDDPLGRRKPPGRLYGFDRVEGGAKNSCQAEHDQWMDDAIDKGPRDSYDAVAPLIGSERSRHIDFPLYLDCLQICYLIRKGNLTDFPTISEDEIKDKSKEDLFMKLLSLWQVLWLCIQLVIRRFYGLSSTQLEVATLSFAICACLTYLVWLSKPKDIGVPRVLHLGRSLTEDDERALRQLQGFEVNDKVLALDRVHRAKLDLRPFSSHDHVAYVGLIAGGIVFGACHCFAWNFAFPTHVEQVLWRVASVTQIVLSPALYWVNYYHKTYWMKVLGRIRDVLVTVSYVIARLFIMVEIFRSLFFSHPRVFEAIWTQSVPQLG